MKILTAFWMTMLPAWAGVNQWTNVGPQSGCCGFLAIDPQDPATFYAGTGTGIFKSKDSGATWINTRLTGLTNLVVDPKNSATLYTLAPGDENSVTTKLFKSTDGGATWNDIFWLPPGGSMLTIDPQDTGTLYVVAEDSRKLLRCSDGGANWTALPQLPGHLIFMALAVDPQNHTLYAAVQGTDNAARPVATVFRSADGGVSWNEPVSGLPTTNPDWFPPRDAITIDPKNPSTLYVTKQCCGAYKSADGGATWRAANSGMPTTNDFRSCCISGVTIDQQNPNTLYVPSMNGMIFKSTNGGLNWTSVGSIPGPGPFAARPQSLVIDPQNTSTIYALTGLGLFRSTDGGATWNLYFRERAIPVSSLVMDPLNPGTIYADRYKTTDAGMSWVPLGSGTVALAIDPQMPWTVYGGVVTEEYCQISKSVDGGGTWVATRSPVGCVSAMAIDQQNLSTLYAGTDRGVYKSTDGGTTWSAMNSGLRGAVIALAVDPLSSGVLYASAGGGVFKSMDGGASWSSAGLMQASYMLAIDPQDTSTIYAATSSGLFQSTDAGATWQDLLSTPVYAVAVSPQRAGTLYAGTDGGPLASTDGGASWSPIPGGPDHIRVLALDPQDPNTVHAGGPAGLFAISLR
jgi:photosystem II stability/assembly factor-like uncharacterized protein